MPCAPAASAGQSASSASVALRNACQSDAGSSSSPKQPHDDRRRREQQRRRRRTRRTGTRRRPPPGRRGRLRTDTPSASSHDGERSGRAAAEPGGRAPRTRAPPLCRGAELRDARDAQHGGGEQDRRSQGLRHGQSSFERSRIVAAALAGSSSRETTRSSSSCTAGILLHRGLELTAHPERRDRQHLVHQVAAAALGQRALRLDVRVMLGQLLAQLLDALASRPPRS